MSLDTQYTLSRQRRYQIRKRKEGLCTICGKRKTDGRDLCIKCATIKRDRQRIKLGHKPKVEGKRGRPIEYI